MGAEYFDTAQLVAASDGRAQGALASLLHEGGAGIWTRDDDPCDDEGAS